MNKVLAEIWDFIKKNFAVLAVIAAVLILYLQGCFKRFEPQPPQVVIVSDTTRTQIQQPQIVVVPYQPTQTGATTYPIVLPKGFGNALPASTLDSLIAQVKELNQRIEALAREYYATRTYGDSIQLKDTAGTRVGVVKLKQTVTENKLVKTEPEYQLSFPLQRIITTITQQTKPRNQVYATIGLQSPVPTMAFNQVELGFQLKNKRSDMFGLSATYQIPTKDPGVRITYSKLIKLNKSP